MSKHLTTSLGAYALGALEPPDRAQVESHLRSCPDCRDQLASIAGLPALLSHLQPTDLDLDLDLAADGSTSTPATRIHTSVVGGNPSSPSRTFGATSKIAPTAARYTPNTRILVAARLSFMRCLQENSSLGAPLPPRRSRA